VLLPGNGSLTCPLQTWILPSCPLQSLQALERSVEYFLGSPIAELSLDSSFPTVLSILIPQDQGKYTVHQAEPLYMVRLNTSGRSPSIPEGAVSDRLTHSHSSHKHGTHTLGLGIVFQGLLLYIRCVLRNRVTCRRLWLFTMRRRSWMERGYNPRLPPLENSSPRAPSVAFW
jgi:hypothetical protein